MSGRIHVDPVRPSTTYGTDPSAPLVAAWFSLRAEDRGAAAVALHALRGRAAHAVAARCRCGIAVAEDHVADAVFVMIYGIRRAPRLRISATTTLAFLCGVARNEWRWDRWRRAQAAQVAVAAGRHRCDDPVDDRSGEDLEQRDAEHRFTDPGAGCSLVHAAVPGAAARRLGRRGSGSVSSSFPR